MKRENHLELKLATIFLAMIFPIIVLLLVGPINSFSLVWKTDLQPLFIFTNAITSYFLFSTERWKFSALFLLCLTCVSVEFSEIIHDILAGLFFISCIKPLKSIKRFKYYLYVYLLSVPIIFIYNLFWFEFIAVWVLCIYHLNYIYVTIKLRN